MSDSDPTMAGLADAVNTALHYADYAMLAKSLQSGDIPGIKATTTVIENPEAAMLLELEKSTLNACAHGDLAYLLEDIKNFKIPGIMFEGELYREKIPLDPT